MTEPLVAYTFHGRPLGGRSEPSSVKKERRKVQQQNFRPSDLNVGRPNLRALHKFTQSYVGDVMPV